MRQGTSNAEDRDVPRACTGIFASAVACTSRDSGLRLRVDIDVSSNTNVSSHKTARVQEFLQQHRNARLHYTPTYTSWLNQVDYSATLRGMALALVGDMDGVGSFAM